MNIFSKISLVTIIILSAISCQSEELINLDIAKRKVQNYYKSEQYEKEVEEIIDDALSELQKIELPENSIAVFDVDDTILSGYEYTKNMGFGYTWESWNEFVQKGTGEVIPQTKRLYDWFIDHNVEVILLTGRRDYMYNVTKENLVLRG